MDSQKKKKKLANVMVVFMVSAALKILGPCCLDVEETTSRRCFPMNVEELLCF